jgi:hypothetical protein
MKTYLIIRKDLVLIFNVFKTDRKEDGRPPTTIIDCWNGCSTIQIATLFKLLSGKLNNIVLVAITKNF